MKTSLLNWVKEDINNNYKVPADYWELEPIIKRVDLANKNIDVVIKLYTSEDAYQSGAAHIKERNYRVDLSGMTGLQDAIITAIKSGVESMQEVDTIDMETGETTYKPGFFAV